jgi:HAD superfamily hydrolase (TIGR01509 family)
MNDSRPALPSRASLDAILLDAGGVLVDPDWHRVSRLLARLGIDMPADRLLAAEPRARWTLDRPEHMDGVDDTRRAFLYYDLVLAGAGRTEPVPPAVWEEVRAEHARSNLWRMVRPGVPEALARLRAAGLRLAVVSNANGTVVSLMQDVGLLSYFDTILDSFVEGVEKPSPEIFRRALSRVDARPERALHVGDLYQVDVLGARSAGVAAALIDTGDFYADTDCPRFSSLPALVDALLA